MQISMFNTHVAFPNSYEDVQQLWEQHIFEGEKDEDAFTWSNISNGRSYKFYNRTVLHLTFTQKGESRLKIPGYILQKIPGQTVKDPTTYYTVSNLSDSDILLLCHELKRIKRQVFRSLITETFACCNDFMRCSDAKQCIHPEDRFYNGCTYRGNLEYGRIFYGRNRNV